MDFEIKNLPDIAIKNLTESSPVQPVLLPGTPVSWHGSEGICSKRHGLSTPLSAPSTASTSHETQEVGSLEMVKLIQLTKRLGCFTLPTSPLFLTGILLYTTRTKVTRLRDVLQGWSSQDRYGFGLHRRPLKS